MKGEVTGRGDGRRRWPGAWSALGRERPFLATCAAVLLLGAVTSTWTFVSSTGRALSLGAGWLAAAWAIESILLWVFAVLLLRRPSDELARRLIAVATSVFSVVLAGGAWIEPVRLGALSARMMLVVVAAGALVRSWRLLIVVWVASLTAWCAVFFGLPDVSRALLDWPLSWLLALILSGFLLLMTTGEGRQAEEATVRLREEAHLDALTGVLNRAGLRVRGQALVQSAARTEDLITCSFIDVNRLKWVNDTHGHAAGDDVLRRVARSLTACTRHGDVVGRWGGDEFLLLRRGHVTDPGDLGRRVAAALDADGPHPPWWGEGSRWVTVGSATERVHPHADPAAALDALIAEADKEMYRRRAQRRA